MSIDPTVVIGIIELGKLGLSMYFEAMKQAGKSDEEMEELYKSERAKFYANRPETLPDV